ncbi:hypothetical protein [Pseudomonas coronafaciens]|uniref:hypothetical protein n=1 Tax=Pseudomonas coronafaciens TaxID=53409 RepID=UPI0006E5AA6B|nr:hypothetical protein [Pseudomonas coronafaciens]KPW30755.1 hypothetical protein ALO66_200017 [Pseudomonas coronafaciens pv. atropurpurea]
MILLNKPRDSDIHTLADFAELLCLVTQDRSCSRETISDQIKDVGDSNISESALDDCFSHLEWRAQSFLGFYPFTLDSGSKNLSAPEELDEAYNLYILLLLCANLPFLEDRSNITDTFERVSLMALEKSWPTGSSVLPFGKNETTYAGTKVERINKLAGDLGGLGLCNEQTFRRGDSGDGGIDLVAWMGLDKYESRNIPSALAQCACSREEWVKKQTEISRDRLNSMIHPTHPWMQLIFIPHCFRNNHGSWAFDGEVAANIVYDRLRIIDRIGGTLDWNLVAPPPLFSEFLAKRLDLV